MRFTVLDSGKQVIACSLRANLRAEPSDLAELAVVVRDQCHAERESVRGYLSVELVNRRTLALQNGVRPP
jgi:hypothetical protein